MIFAYDLWLRNGTCITVKHEDADICREMARKIYDSIPELEWQCRRP